MRKSVLTLAAVALLLTACSPAAVSAGSDVQGQIETSVALTVEAQNQIATSVALTIAAQLPTATNTATITPTSATPPTFTPVIPTVTPLPPPSGTGGGVPPKPEFACDVIRQRPFDNTEFSAGAEFDIKWTIVNTGTRSWYEGFDLKYLSGPNMTTGATRIQLPAMDPGDQYSVVFDAVAPNEKGFHVMTWVVDGPTCYPYVAIFVK
ncbi:MAG: NBR1-Ig-like domain-containing protein [Chloroflexota bacterium]